MKKVFMFCAALLLCGSALWAQEPYVIDSGPCGIHVTWSLSSDSVLTFSGHGDTDSYIDHNYPPVEVEAPWTKYDSKITRIVFEEGINSISEGAFETLNNIKEIYCLALKPPHLDASANNNKSITVFCNRKSVFKYSQTLGWRQFGDHVAFSFGRGSYGDRPEEMTKWILHTDSLLQIDLGGFRLDMDKGKFPWLDFADKIKAIQIITTDMHADISPGAFKNCPNLQKVYIGSEMLPYIDASVFEGTDISKVDLYVNAHEVDHASHMKPWSSFASINPITSMAEGTWEGFKWSFDWSGTLIVSGNGAMPEALHTAAPWAECADQIKKVVFREGITKVGNNCFSFIESLTTVELPASVTCIGRYAFQQCYNLRAIYGGSNLNRVESCALEDSKYLNDLNSYSGSAYLGTVLIKYKGTAADYTEKATTTCIYDDAFSDNQDIVNIVLPDNVSYVGSASFSDCGKLESVIFKGEVNELLLFLFDGCYALKSLMFANDNPPSAQFNSLPSQMFDIKVPPASVELYKKADFLKDKNIIPYAVTSGFYGEKTPDGQIGKDVTWSVDEIGRLVIEGKGKMYDGPAPWDPNSFSSVYIKDGVTNVTNHIFSRSKINYAYIAGSVKEIGVESFWSSQLETLILNEGLETIHKNAFNFCGKLGKVHFPNSLRRVEDKAFQKSGLNFVNTDSLEYVGYYAFHDTYWYDNYKPYNGTAYIGKSLYEYCGNYCEVIDMPDDILYVTQMAFWNKSAKQISLSPSLQSIENSAFDNCQFPSVTIPASVKNIALSAFASNNNLKDIIVLGETPCKLAQDAFKNINPGAIFYVPVGSLDKYKSAPVWKDLRFDELPVKAYGQQDGLSWRLYNNGQLLVMGNGNIPEWTDDKALWYPYRDQISSLVIKGSIDSIKNQAFANLPALDSIVLSLGVSYIGEQAFAGCPKLKSAYLPASLRCVESEAFINCAALQTVNEPEDLDFVGKDAFKATPWIESAFDDGIIVIGNTVYGYKGQIPENYVPANYGHCVYINDNALQNCVNLASFKLPDNLKIIGDSAFYGCSSLKNIMLTNYIETIGRSAFEGCSGLKHIFVSAYTPPAHNEKCFEQGTTVYVDQNKIERYETQWKDLNLNFVSVLSSGYCGDPNEQDINFIIDTKGNMKFMGHGRMKEYGSDYIPWRWEKGDIVSVTFDDEITSLCSYAFMDCSKLESITLPDCLEHISYKAVSRCEKLKSIVLPDKIRQIDEWAVSECSNLSKIVVPESVDKVGNFAFTKTRWLNDQKQGELYLGNTFYTFCRRMPKNYMLKLKEGTKYMAEDIFENPSACENLAYLGLTDSFEASRNFLFQENNIKRITISKNVDIVSEFASGCQLTSLVIPKNINKIEYSFFFSVPQYIVVENSGCDINGCFRDIAFEQSMLLVPKDDELIFTAHKDWSKFKNIKGFIGHGEFGKQGDNLSWVITSDGYLYIFGVGEMNDFASADMVPWHSLAKDIKHIEIQESVSSISRFAFSGCSALTSISAMTVNPPAIDQSVFEGVDKSTVALSVPKKSVPLYKAADVWKEFLNLSHPADVTGNCGDLGDNLKWTLDCDGLLTISGTGNMQAIEFRNAPWENFIEDIKNVVIEEGVATISDNALCFIRVDSISLPGSLTRIGMDAFYNLTVNNIYIHGLSPAENSGLTWTNSEHTAYVPAAAFNNYKSQPGWNNLNLTAVISSGFCGDPKVNEGRDVKWSIVRYKDDSHSLLIEGRGCMQDFYSASDAPWAGYSHVYENVVISDYVTSIGNNAFAESNIKNVTVGYDVTKIGEGAFADCASLSSVVFVYPHVLDFVGGDAFKNTPWYNDNAIIPLGDVYLGNTYYAYKGEMPADHKVVVRPGTKYVASSAMLGQANLKQVEMPDEISFIGSAAFSGCSALKSVSIPDSVQSVEHNAFFGCEALSFVTLPEKLKAIRPNAFKNCRSLSFVNIPEGTVSINSYAFANCDSLKGVMLPSTINNIEDDAFVGSDSIQNVYLKKNAVPYMKRAFTSVRDVAALYVPMDAVETFKNSYDCGFANVRGFDGTDFCGAEDGSQVIWMVADSALSVLGSGSMAALADPAPWAVFNDKIDSVMIDKNICSVDNAVFECDKAALFKVGGNVKVNRLAVNSDREFVPSMLVAGSVSADSFLIRKAVDNVRPYAFALPVDCRVADVYVEGHDDWVYGTDFVIYQVDQKDVASSMTLWNEISDVETMLNADRGYAVAVTREGDATVVFAADVAGKISAPEAFVYDFGAYDWFTEGANAAFSGWSMLANPYMQALNASAEVIGSKFISVPNADGVTFDQYRLADVNSVVLAPLGAYLVQVGENAAPSVALSDKALAPALPEEEAQVENGHLCLTLELDGGTAENAGGSKEALADKATLISTSSTAGYVVGEDLTKFIGLGARPQIYSLEGEAPLAFNARSIGKHESVAVGIYAPAAGTYTFSAVCDGDLAGMKLVDLTMDVTTELGTSAYTVTLDQGTCDDRFVLRRVDYEPVACDPVYDSESFENVSVVTTEGGIAIEGLADGSTVRVYDAVGHLLYVTDQASDRIDLQVAAKGVYMISIQHSGSSMSVKVVR